MVGNSIPESFRMSMSKSGKISKALSHIYGHLSLDSKTSSEIDFLTIFSIKVLFFQFAHPLALRSLASFRAGC